MKIQYLGDSAIDVAGHVNVTTGDVLDLPNDVAESLLLAGCSVDDDGAVTPAVAPLWKQQKATTAKSAPNNPTEPADAGKES